MLTIKAAKEKITELSDRVQAIVEMATEEKRNLTPEEQTEIDSIQGSGEDEGQIGEIKVQLNRLEKIEARQKDIAARRVTDSGTLDKQSGEFNMSAVKVPAKAKSRGNLQSFKGPDAEKEAYVAGLFYQAALFRNQNAMNKLNDLGVPMAQSTFDNTAGGFLVPDSLESSIIRLVEDYSVFRRESRVFPLGPGELTIPRRAGGYTAYFAGESSDSSSAAVTKSDVTLDAITLRAKKLMVLSEWSTELPEDAIAALGDLITQEMAYVIANKEDDCGFNGDGTSTYGGIVGAKNALAAGSIVDTAAGDDTAAEVLVDVFNEAIGKLPRYAGIMPKWYVHQTTWANIMQRLAIAGGGNTVTNYEQGLGMSFLGYPVVISQIIESVGPAEDDSGTIFGYFGDLRMSAAFGDRRGLEVTSDMGGKYFESDMVGLKGRTRFDINVHERGSASAAGSLIALRFNAS